MKKPKSILKFIAFFMIYLVLSLVLMNNVSAIQQSVSLSTGDLSLDIPLMKVPGVNGLDYPILIAYTGGDGIRVAQEASWVGLGWTLDSGAVRRSVVGAPDDMDREDSGINIYMDFKSLVSDNTPGWERVVLVLIMIGVGISTSYMIGLGVGDFVGAIYGAISGDIAVSTAKAISIIISGLSYTSVNVIFTGELDWGVFIRTVAFQGLGLLGEKYDIMKDAMNIYGYYGKAQSFSSLVGAFQGAKYGLCSDESNSNDCPSEEPQNQDGFLYDPNFQENYAYENAMIHDGGQPDYWSISGSPASGRMILAHENVGDPLVQCKGFVECSEVNPTYDYSLEDYSCRYGCTYYPEEGGFCDGISKCEDLDLTPEQCGSTVDLGVSGCYVTEGIQEGRFSGINDARFYPATTSGKDNVKIEFFTNLDNCNYLPSHLKDTCSNYNEEIDQFVVTTTDGTKYVYGDPNINGSIVRVHASGSYSKYEEEVPNKYSMTTEFKTMTLQHYPYEWKLTAILSPDYVDGTPNPDFNPLNSESNNKGSWIAFNYDMKYSFSDFSGPGDNCGFNIGKPWDGEVKFVQGVNNENGWSGVSGGYQDISYLKEIITPTHKAVFETSERLDGEESKPWKGAGDKDPWNWNFNEMDWSYGYCYKDTREVAEVDHLYKLDEIKLISRLDDSVVSTVKFNKGKYWEPYDLKVNSPGVAQSSWGVYSLKTIHNCDASGSSCLRPIKFEYQEGTANPNYDENKVDVFGMYYARGNENEHASPTDLQSKFASRSGSGLTEVRVGSGDAYAWTLKKVKWPTGATTEWDYEIDTWFTSRGDVEQPIVNVDGVCSGYKYCGMFDEETCKESWRYCAWDNSREVCNQKGLGIPLSSEASSKPNCEDNGYDWIPLEEVEGICTGFNYCGMFNQDTCKNKFSDYCDWHEGHCNEKPLQGFWATGLGFPPASAFSSKQDCESHEYEWKPIEQVSGICTGSLINCGMFRGPNLDKCDDLPYCTRGPFGSCVDRRDTPYPDGNGYPYPRKFLTEADCSTEHDYEWVELGELHKNYYAYLRDDNVCEANYGGGLRIKRQKDCDEVTGRCAVTEYDYTMEDPDFLCTRTSGSIGNVPVLLGKTNGMDEADLRRRGHIAGPQTVGSVLYNRVKVNYGRSEVGGAPVFDKGYNVFYYLTTDSDKENTEGAIDVPSQDEFSGPDHHYTNYNKIGSEAQVSTLWKRGQEYKIQTYNNEDVMLEELKRYYKANEHLTWYFGDMKANVSSGAPDDPNYFRDAFGVSSGWTNLDNITTLSYDPVDGNKVAVTTENIFDEKTGFPTQVKEENFDKDKITEIYYAHSNPAYSEMRDKNMLIQLYKQITYKNSLDFSNVKSATLTTYKDFGSDRWFPYQTKELIDLGDDGIFQEGADISLLRNSFESYDDYGHATKGLLVGSEDTALYTVYGDEYNGAWSTRGWNDASRSQENPNWIKSYYSDGLVKSVTDENGQITEYEYDNINRLWKVAKPGDSLNDPTVKYEYHQSTGQNDPNYVKVTTKIDDSRYSEVIGFNDGFGNPIQTQTKKDNNGNYIVKSAEYDSYGRKIKEYKAVEADTDGVYKTVSQLESLVGGMEYTEFVYYNDPTNRIKKKIFPDGNYITYSYGIKTDQDGNGKPTITVRDENNNLTRYTYDLLGNLIRVEEKKVGQGDNYEIVFNYEYDVLGNLIKITDPYGRIISQYYDASGRLKQAEHPDIGTTNLTYSGPLGKPTTRVDSKEQVTSYSYDDLNRIKEVTYG